jgi:hypothetical protein
MCLPSAGALSGFANSLRAPLGAQNSEMQLYAPAAFVSTRFREEEREVQSVRLR